MINYVAPLGGQKIGKAASRHEHALKALTAQFCLS